MKHLLPLLLLLLAPALRAQTIDLSGRWQFTIDRDARATATSAYDDDILLPASMPQRMKGDRPTVDTRWTGALYDSSYFYRPDMAEFRRPDNFKVPFFLTPTRHYEGRAWYRRTVAVPAAWAGRRLTLFLERPHITTTLYINGQLVGSQNSLSVAHEYDVTSYVKAGAENTLALLVDNDIRPVGVGGDSHSVTDQTQGNWNGLAGRLELRAQPLAYIQQLDIFPLADLTGATARILVRNQSGRRGEARLQLTGSNGLHADTLLRLPKDTLTLTLPIQGFGPEPRLWDEFHPNLYTLAATLTSPQGEDRQETQFGLRRITCEGKKIMVNGLETVLRGTVENCDFPNTGYAPTDEASWERVFRICKRYGLNHMRFHSFCPPEAAFRAADRLGFYLQPEGPTWPNHGVKLGVGQIIDTYLMEETQRMVARYGNHPSFTMLSSGNEPAGNWVAWVSKFVDYWKQTDPRRIYTGASVGGGWAWQPRNEYHVKAGARGLDEWRRHAPESTYDFQAKIDTVSQPFVSHETGQWCAFPDLDEGDQYTGVNRALNMDIFRKLLANNHMEGMARRFMMASGRLQALCYKHEMERILRTKGYAGFQLLALNDYSGQGSAIVGPLNVFFREKGYVDDREFTESCAPTVVMARLPRFTYWDTEAIEAQIDVARYDASPAALPATLQYTLTDDCGRQVASGALPEQTLERGLTQRFGHIKWQGEMLDEARHLTLQITLTSGAKQLAVNHYELWLYPHSLVARAQAQPAGVYITDTLSQAALDTLASGGRVLIAAAGRVKYGRDVVQQFTPVFWNTSWFKMRPPHTVGLYVQQEHPALRHFPTQYYSNMQWWDLVNRQQVMQFDEFPADFQPIVQSIDTWFLSRKIGMLFEARVGRGRLMMTTMPLTVKGGYEAHPAMAQMRQSLLDYMLGPDFEPTLELAPDLISHLFTREAPKVNMYTKDSPDELKKGVK